MIFIYICTAIMVFINLGNSLESTRNQSPSEERYNFFDAELLQVFNQKRNENVLISPVSIKLVLGMLLEGAEDTTATEIRSALRLPENREARRKEFNTWLSALQQTKESENIIRVANRMFLSDESAINPEYGKTLSKHYSGGVTKVKFQDAKEATHVINTWVSNQTSHLIRKMVRERQISPGDKLLLASAIYFRGFWSSPFASERTTVRCFYSEGDKCKNSLVMMETGYFNYGYVSRLDAKAIVLPYKGGKFSMLLLLPSKKDGVGLLTRDLMHVSLASVLSELKEEEVFVQIPQFEISYNDDLVDILRTVQIRELFTPAANLSKMLTNHTESTSVNHIYQSVKITVNEQGSEAAAATGAVFVPLMGGTTTSFVANYPFLFFVMSSAKNSVLFAGKIIFPQMPKDPKKRTFSLGSQNQTSKKSQGTVNSVILSSTRTPVTLVNPASTKKDETSDKTFQESKISQQAAPKFRSIKPIFSIPWLQSNERKVNDAAQFDAQRTYAGILFEKETQNIKKRGKTAQEQVLKNRKRQEQPADDWRHHVLFFT